MFKGYGKIYALSKDESAGILNGYGYIQEKIDGANLSIWMEDGVIKVGSRTQEVKDGFRGAVDYVKNHHGIGTLLILKPEFRLYGEWLVPHTITNYNPESYNHFYLIDIEDGEGNRLPLTEVITYANSYGIKSPHLFYEGELSDADPFQYIGTSKIGPAGEGVVIKNYDFINQFGERTHAKIVHEQFKEDNGIVFGNAKKDSEDYAEAKIAFAGVNVARVRKIINKIEQNEDRDVSKADINKIIGMVYKDIFEEELWDAVKKYPVLNFKLLQKNITARGARIAVDIIDGNVESVAFN